MLNRSFWISPSQEIDCPVFLKDIIVKKGLIKAEISMTATGIYEGFLNGTRIGDFIFAPGWTNYEKRLQYQTYDITNMLKCGENHFEISVFSGWYDGLIARDKRNITKTKNNFIAEIILEYNDKTERIITDESWQAKEGKVRFADIYDGEIYDANFESSPISVKNSKINRAVLISQEGEKVIEHQRISPVGEFTTPKGERVIDFGQEVTGYVEIETDAKVGDQVNLSFAEVMDCEGNFYNENYRKAKCKYVYLCKDGKQTYKPHGTFYGFRYIKVNEAPKNTKFTAIVVYSDIKRTGYLETENKNLNQLFSNIIWGQKDNFLDIPTDCPQRNERLGWLGDAQVFIKTATYQFGVKKFFEKWLNDMMSEQEFDGQICDVVPDVLHGHRINEHHSSPAWGDASIICPWVLYEMYGDKNILVNYLPMMEKWISYVESDTIDEHLWTGVICCYGDWLGLDAPSGTYKGSTRDDFIASAFYVYTCRIMSKVMKELGDPEGYEKYLVKTDLARKAFINRFPTAITQTEHVLQLHFDLTDEKEKVAKSLAEMIHQNGDRLKTGFVGTPYLLFALSENGYTDLAYTLLLQDKYPSWLYSVSKGATTIWEHWDGIKEDGSFWSKDMNSFNHYAYGSVAEWVFSVASGIVVNENGIEIAPNPDKRLGYLNAEFESRFGTVVSNWKYDGDKVTYEIEIPTTCNITINGNTKQYEKGTYKF